MARPKVNPKNEQRRFEIDELFFSTTDKVGVIQSGNDVFRRVAGYDSLDELIGKPHNIIRHPDMPRCVFKLLWDYLGAGKPIVAYVKNLATDGAYYWVLAYAVPTEGGYLSVRFKPSSPLLSTVEALYKDLCAIEAEAEGKPGLRQQAMEAAGEKLLGALSTLGFVSYDAFMRAAMVAEMSSRATHLSDLHRTTASASGSGHMAEAIERYLSQESLLDSMFSRAERILKTIDLLDANSKKLDVLAASTHLLAMNGLISCKRMGDSARGLSVVAQELSAIAKTSGLMIQDMNSNLRDFVRALHSVSFRISAAKLQVGIALVFLQEVAARREKAGANLEVEHLKDLEVLAATLKLAKWDLNNSLPELSIPVGPLRRLLDELSQVGRSLSCVYHMGQVEAASGDGDRFKQLLRSLGGQVSGIRPIVEGIRTGIDSVIDEIPSLELEESRLLRFEEPVVSHSSLTRSKVLSAA